MSAKSTWSQLTLTTMKVGHEDQRWEKLIGCSRVVSDVIQCQHQKTRVKWGYLLICIVVYSQDKILESHRRSDTPPVRGKCVALFLQFNLCDTFNGAQHHTYHTYCTYFITLTYTSSCWTFYFLCLGNIGWQLQFLSLNYDTDSLVIGYWLLVIGYWLLVIGYWLLVG